MKSVEGLGKPASLPAAQPTKSRKATHRGDDNRASVTAILADVQSRRASLETVQGRMSALLAILGDTPAGPASPDTPAVAAALEKFAAVPFRMSHRGDRFDAKIPEAADLVRALLGAGREEAARRLLMVLQPSQRASIVLQTLQQGSPPGLADPALAGAWGPLVCACGRTLLLRGQHEDFAGLMRALPQHLRIALAADMGMHGKYCGTICKHAELVEEIAELLVVAGEIAPEHSEGLLRLLGSMATMVEAMADTSAEQAAVLREGLLSLAYAMRERLSPSIVPAGHDQREEVAERTRAGLDRLDSIIKPLAQGRVRFLETAAPDVLDADAADRAMARIQLACTKPYDFAAACKELEVVSQWGVVGEEALGAMVAEVSRAMEKELEELGFRLNTAWLNAKGRTRTGVEFTGVPSAFPLDKLTSYVAVMGRFGGRGEILRSEDWLKAGHKVLAHFATPDKQGNVPREFTESERTRVQEAGTIVGRSLIQAGRCEEGLTILFDLCDPEDAIVMGTLAVGGATGSRTIQAATGLLGDWKGKNSSRINREQALRRTLDKLLLSHTDAPTGRQALRQALPSFLRQLHQVFPEAGPLSADPDKRAYWRDGLIRACSDAPGEWVLELMAVDLGDADTTNEFRHLMDACIQAGTITHLLGRDPPAIEEAMQRTGVLLREAKGPGRGILESEVFVTRVSNAIAELCARPENAALVLAAIEVLLGQRAATNDAEARVQLLALLVAAASKLDLRGNWAARATFVNALLSCRLDGDAADALAQATRHLWLLPAVMENQPGYLEGLIADAAVGGFDALCDLANHFIASGLEVMQAGSQGRTREMLRLFLESFSHLCDLLPPRNRAAAVERMKERLSLA